MREGTAKVLRGTGWNGIGNLGKIGTKQHPAIFSLIKIICDQIIIKQTGEKFRGLRNRKSLLFYEIFLGQIVKNNWQKMEL